MLDLDQYYTPIDLAERFLSDEISTSPKVCVDTTCGEGNLLKAATKVFDEINCVGLDRDEKAIKQLKKEHPDWALSVANLLQKNSYNRSKVASSNLSADLLLLNPPFSLSNRKYVTVEYNGESLKTSIAMAHILRSFGLFSPKQGALIIVPESVLYSETDAEARSKINAQYSINKIAELNNTTFTGARVNSTIIKITLGTSSKSRKNSSHNLKQKIAVSLHRGGLPVHEFRKRAEGVPYFHTTCLKKLHKEGISSSLGYTEKIRKGRVSKWVLLIPRVGIAKKEASKPIYFRSQVQLSDCIFAITFRNKDEALFFKDFLYLNWESFKKLYRGTGARYLTLARLTKWLNNNGISISD